MKAVLYDGRKATRIDDLPPEAWTAVLGGGQGYEARKLWKAVAWLYRCVDVRATAAATMPWDLVRVKTGDVVATDESDPSDYPVGMDWLASLASWVFLVEAATVLTGQAYMGRMTRPVAGRGLPAGLQWFRPGSVSPIIDKATGDLKGFNRKTTTEPKKLKVDEVVYFWPLDPDVEVGPAEATPARAALAAAGVIHSQDDFLTSYFDRGMVKATVLKYSDPMDPEDAQDLKDWWARVFNGVRNAFTTEVIRDDIDVMTIGEGLKEIQTEALVRVKREDVATAMGVPQSKVTANAANYATKKGDDQTFITDTMGPRMKWMAGVFNEQVFHPLGFHLKMKPDRLPVMMEDENERSGSLMNLRAAGMGLMASRVQLGYDDLPDDVPLRDEQGQPDQALAGAQISGALEIVQAYHDGKLDRDGAVNFIVAGLGLEASLAESLVPQEAKGPAPIPPALAQNAGLSPGPDDSPEDDNGDTKEDPEPDQKSAEIGRLTRWLKNRLKAGQYFTWADFQTDILTMKEVNRTAAEVIAIWTMAQAAVSQVEDLPDPDQAWARYQKAMDDFDRLKADLEGGGGSNEEE